MSDQRLLAFSFANADLLIEADTALAIRYVSGAVHSLTGRSTAELDGTKLEQLFVPRDRAMVAAAIGRLGGDSRLNPMKVSLRGAKGKAVGAILAGCRIDRAGPHYYLTLTRAGLSADTLALQRDERTGLLDADGFAKVVADGAAAAQKLGLDGKLTLIRIDALEAYRARASASDTERMIEEIAGLLRAVSVDGEAAGRLADDRFGVMHPTTVGAEALNEGIGAIGRKYDPTGAGITLTQCTLDVAHDEFTPADTTKMIRYAIRRFAEADDGAFALTTLADGMREMLTSTVGRVQRLKQTVASGDLRIALQPIVTLADVNLHHFEALARPTDDQTPQQLISFAEQIGMAQDLDLMICEKVIDVLSEAVKAGHRPHIAFNISAASLTSEVFIGCFRRLMEPRAALRQLLMIEITESMQISDLAAANKALILLRQDGHKVCLDDFGAGAASFQYIQALDVDHVKIDGAYVRRMDDNARDWAIMKAMVGLCRDLGVGIIAEMIETERQRDRLKALGVDMGQGYLFGKPTVDYDFTKAPRPRPAGFKDAVASAIGRGVVLRRRSYLEKYG